MRIASVYVRPAEVLSKKKWVVQWQTPLMPAPAFWYYGSQTAAMNVGDRLVKSLKGEEVKKDDLGW